MARISANNYGSSLFTTLLLLTIRCNNGASPAEAFVTRYRSPLFMSKNNIGDSSSSSSNSNSNSNQIDTVGTSSSYADDKMGKSFLSVSTSPPPPLASTSSDSTTERSRTRQNNNISNNNNNNNVYRGKGRPTTMATVTAEASTKTKTKTKKIAAPLVDSTLLRFLSAQKSQLAAENYEETTENTSYVRNGSDGNSSSNGKIVGNADSNGKSNGTTDTNSNLNSNNISSNGSTDTASADTTSLSNGKTDSSSIRSIVQIKNLMNETELIQSMTDNLMRSNNEDVDIDSKNTKSNRISPNNKNKQNINNNNTSTKKTTSSRVDDTTADSISWFTQYNAHNVAKKLIKLGATETEAEEAGNIVQNYSLTRTTRQRVRKFLSDRDSIWASASKQKESVDLNFQTSVRERNYNIDDIIEVLTDAGLTGKDIAAIFVHTPSVSMMKAKGDSDSTNADGSIDTSSNGGSLEDNLNRAYFGVLCSKIKLRKYDARKVLRTCPNLLTKRGSTSSEEVISILANLGVAPTSLCRDKSALPILLSRSPASLFRLVAFLSSDAVRMPVNRIGPLFRRSECASLLDHVAPLSQNLNSHSVDSLFNSGGNVMETEITRRYKMMFQTAKYLRREIDILDLGRSISAYPNILTLDIEKDISPCIDFLCEEVGLDEEDDVPSVLELYPQLLGENIDGMREKMTYLISLEVAEEDLGSIFRAFPALLTLDIASMKNVVDFLKGAGVTNIGRFVTRLPSVLGYSVEKDLLPKWRYLAKFSHQYASFEISRFPAYFSYPFDRVIKSRYEYLNMKQLPVQLLSIDEVLRYGDRDFATLVARDEDASLYATFAKERKKQQKKNSQSKKKPKKRKKDSSQ